MRRVSFALGVATLAVVWVSGRAVATAPVGSVDTSAIRAERVGTAALVDADRRGVQLSKGGSTTEFSLALPDDASCPGDSRNDNWRVQTFIVPTDVDPGSVEYGPNGPTGKHQWALYDTVTSPVIEGLLVPNDQPGSPGGVDAFPPMSFEVFPVGEIPPGKYRVGAACTWFGATGSYWDVEMVFSSDPVDRPSQLAWRVPGVSEATEVASSAVSTPPWSAIFVVIAVFSFGVAFFLGRRPGQPKRSIQ
ncbi:MAG: hypothetical protein KGR47_09150 [Acidobacteria bacterium]|nr:hypothetical protein [Acidobacteriota bacterium]